MSLHMERLEALRCRPATLIASTPTSSSGDSRLGDGGHGASGDRVRQGARPIRRRSWTKAPWHEGPRGQERWERRLQERQRGAETLSKQRVGHERHARDAIGEAGLVGNSWWPSP